MKVELRLPQQDVDANVIFYGPNGQEVKVSRIVVEPIFRDPKQRVPVIYATTMIECVKQDGAEGAETQMEEIHRAVLQVGGTNGKTVLLDRSKRVKPLFEANRLKSAKAENKVDKPPAEPETPPGSEQETTSEEDSAVIQMPDSQTVSGGK